MEPAISSVSDPDVRRFAEIAQVIGVMALFVALVSLIVNGFRSESDPRCYVDSGRIAARRRLQRRLITDDDLERDDMRAPLGGTPGEGGSG